MWINVDNIWPLTSFDGVYDFQSFSPEQTGRSKWDKTSCDTWSGPWSCYLSVPVWARQLTRLLDQHLNIAVQELVFLRVIGCLHRSDVTQVQSQPNSFCSDITSCWIIPVLQVMCAHWNYFILLFDVKPSEIELFVKMKILLLRWFYK